MADPSTHPDFDLDTALSAELDGELDAYAAELGLPADDVRAALATPPAVARRAQLAAAQDALRTEPVPDALDDVTRRRLLAGAGVGTSRAPAHRDRGWLLRPAAAAAITLVVLGGLYAIFHDSGGSGGSADKSGAGSAAAVAVTGDLGDVGTIDAAQVEGLLQGTVTPGTGKPAPTANDAAKGADAGAASEFAPGAVDDCATAYGDEGAIRFRGSGTYQGRPAVVLGIDTDQRTIVFVVAAADCGQVLYSASR